MKVKFKKLFVLLLAVAMVFAALLPLNPFAVASAEEDSKTVTSSDFPDKTEKEYNPVTLTEKLANIDSADVVQVTQAIEEDLIEQGTSVEESLHDQLDYYTALADRTEDEDEIARINDMISATKSMIIKYQKISNDKYHILRKAQIQEEVNSSASKVFMETCVMDAIAWFNASNYLLSAELLTRSCLLTHPEKVYLPIHGNRVISSPITYDILNYELLNSHEISKEWIYETVSPSPFNNFSRNEEDLGFAIHGFWFERNSIYNKKITIHDIYDFHFRKEISVLNKLNNIFYEAQEAGIVKIYDYDINIDLAEPLNLTVLKKESGVYTLNVQNYSDSNITVYYNEQMCTGGDAENWTGLTHIKKASISKNGKATLQIRESGVSTHIALSYIKNGIRIVTFADEVSTDNHLNTEISKINVPYYDDIALMGKYESTWYFNVKNTRNEMVKVEYNTQMCSSGDAQNWVGLRHLNAFDLNVGASQDITIKENGASTHIALRMIGSEKEYYIYANQLDAKGTMNVGRRTLNRYTYLTISNQGKGKNGWEITVHNPLNREVTVYYNEKMCLFADAKNWTGLNDVKEKLIPAYGNVQITIGEKWCTSSITVSYWSNGRRLITYADNLNKNGTMSVYYNYI